jgi:hypothetical protein
MTEAERPAELSPRQRCVLATLTRLGEATVPDLHEHFPGFAPSAIHRVLQALARKELVVSSGDPSRIYLGGVVFWPKGLSPGVDERLEVIDAELREAGVRFDHWIDLDRKGVVVVVPVEQWVWGLVAYDTAELNCRREAVIGLRASDQVERVRMDTCVTSDAEQREAFALELFPATEAAGTTSGAESGNGRSPSD